MASRRDGLPFDVAWVGRLALRLCPDDLAQNGRDELESILVHHWHRLHRRSWPRFRFLLFLVRDLLAVRSLERRSPVGGGRGGRFGRGPGHRRFSSSAQRFMPASLGRSALQDLRFGWRSLRRTPVFTLTAIVTLALGVGANAAIFSVVNAAVLAPLPYPDADRIYKVGVDRWSPARQVDALRERVETFSALTGAGQGGFTLREAAPERIAGTVVWPDFFAVLGLRPVLGRELRPEDTLPDAEPVVLLSHSLWVRAFGADSEIVGRTIRLEGENRAERTVVGVLAPEHDAFPWPSSVVVPVELDPGSHDYSDNFRYWLLGRLAPGVTEAEANAELRTLTERLAAVEDPIFSSDDPARMAIRSFRESRVGESGRTLLVLLAAVGAVLLIACVNVANLLLARTSSRRAEVAVRAALGAGRGRIVRQLLTESVLLSSIGGAVGMILSWTVVGPLAATLPTAIPRQADVRIDLAVVGFGFGISVLAGLVFGIAPAWRASGRRLAISSTRSGAHGTGGSRLHGVLLAAEVGLAVVLLVAAGLLGKSLWQLTLTDPGFDPGGAVALHVAPPADVYEEAEARAGFYRRVLERVESIPGVQVAGASSSLPVSSGVMGVGVSPDGAPVPEGEPSKLVGYRAVTPGAFAALGLRLREGRFLADSDLGGPPVAVINARLAGELWPDASAIGQEIAWGTGDPWVTVVGVVEDVHQASLAEPPGPEVYVSYAAEGTWLSALYLVIRHEPGVEVMEAARAAVWEVDDQVPITGQTTLSGQVRDSLAGERGWVVVFGSFAALALVLAAVGVFGVTSYLAGQRRHEMGVRSALGAGRADLLSTVLRTGLGPTLLGLAAGSGAAMLSGRLLEGLLHGVRPADPLVLLGVVAFLAAVACAANLVPAWRASRVDPVRALRSD